MFPFIDTAPRAKRPAVVLVLILINTLVFVWIIPLFIPVPAILFAAIWFGLQVLQGTSELASPGMASAVAWWAHIGGFAFGALYAMVANGMGVGMQTPTTVWAATRGRRVPDFPPRDRGW